LGIESPGDDAAGREDGVVEELIDDVDCDAGLDVAPEGDDGGYDLGAGGGGGVADGGEAVFGALDVGEDVGKGFRADVAEGGDVGVCGGEDRGVSGGGVDGGKDGVDVGVGGFAFEEADELFRLGGVGCCWRC